MFCSKCTWVFLAPSRDVGVGGQVAQHVRALQGLGQVHGEEVALDEREVFILEHAGHELPLARGQVVHSYDLVAPSQELVGQVAGDEAGAAGHHDLSILELH